MMVPFCRKSIALPWRHWAIPLVVAWLVLPLAAEKRGERKSLLDSDPNVVYLDRSLQKPIELKVVKEAAVFSDTEGKLRLGSLKANQTVRLEAITAKIYRVRGQGTRDGIAGWVTPTAFTSPDPQFVAHLKQLYERQIQVQKLIDARKIAIGMTLDEVTMAYGKPTKTSLRKTQEGESGRWEFIDYEEVRHYVTRVDPVTKETYRQLVSITREEKSRTDVEFENNIVVAIEESENKKGAPARIIVPPLVFGG
jgi:hypothetical protein